MITRIDIWKRLPETFWPNLAVGIIYRACMDYEDRLVALYFETDPHKSRAKYDNFKEAHDFFGSEWYYVLTSIDHKKMIRAMNKKVAERIRTGQIKRKYQTLWGAFE